MRIVYRLKAFDELRTTEAAQADIDRRAEAWAAACGEGFEVLPAKPGRKRARRAVAAVSLDARRENERNNTILSNLDSAR